MKKPIHLLLGAYRTEVLGLLLLRPEESFYVREVARLTNLPAGSLHRELKVLEKAGLLLREEVGNQVRYRANRGNPIFPELAAIFAKTTGLADLLRDALKPLARKIELAFVFGSIAHGTERASSDVDVFVVGTATLGEVVEVLSPLSPRLGREINPVAMTREKAARSLQAEETFMKQVAGEPKIFLIGSENDLSELGRDRAA